MKIPRIFELPPPSYITNPNFMHCYKGNHSKNSIYLYYLIPPRLDYVIVPKRPMICPKNFCFGLELWEGFGAFFASNQAIFVTNQHKITRQPLGPLLKVKLFVVYM